MFIPCEQNTPEWLSLRKTGIGASDIGTILGLNDRYGSAEKVCEEKRSIVFDEEPKKYAMIRGHLKESGVANIFTYYTGIKTQVSNGIYKSDAYPYLLSSLDRTVEHGIVELKTGGTNAKRLYATGMPFRYWAQVQQGMFCSGYDIGYLAFDLANDTFHIYRITSSQAFQEILIRYGRMFWDAVEAEEDAMKDYYLYKLKESLTTEQLLVTVSKEYDYTTTIIHKIT